MLFTIEFFRLREEDDAHATLDRITHIGTDLEAVKVKAKSLFETLNMPQKPDGLRILDQDGDEVFFWTPGADGPPKGSPMCVRRSPSTCAEGCGAWRTTHHLTR